MPSIDDLVTEQINPLVSKLQKRAVRARLLERYYEENCPIPDAIVQARVTKAYRLLMPMATGAWGSLIVDSVQDRLEVSGIRSGNQQVDDAVWGVWQDNSMDAESKYAHNAALIAGRCFATVWPEGGGPPQITLDNSEQMIVQYEAGSRRRRRAALRLWHEGDVPYCNLFRPDGIYKFSGPKNSSGFQGTQWKPRAVPGEDWPLKNPYDLVTVVELAVNRRLKPGMWGHARGEFAHVLGLIDRINLLTFLGLVVAFYMGFPLRGTIGEQIRRRVLTDDDGNDLIGTDGKPQTEPIPPFDAHAAGIFQLENPQAEIVEYKAADRGMLSIYPELDQLATLTKTPRHYLPMEHGMANLSADAIRASEGGLVAKVPSHKASLGEGWEEVLRLSGMMLDEPVELSQRAELDWKDHETRSLAERADAASKLKDILPWQPIAEMVLNASQEQIARWESQRTAGALPALLAAAAAPVVPPAVQPAAA